MSDEVLELSWLLAKEDGPDERLEVSPYKAYFCLKVDRLHEIGERPTEYEEALKQLSSIG